MPRRRLIDALIWLAGLAITAFAIFPIVWALLTSLKKEEAIITTVMQYIPREITFENYVAIWTRSNFPTLLTNSAITTAIVQKTVDGSSVSGIAARSVTTT